MNPKDHAQARHGESFWQWTIVGRFFLLAATLGGLAGVYEAVFLYMTPRVPALRQPDVSYVIWFVAPLAGMFLFGLLGFAVGLVVTGIKHITTQKLAAAALVGLAGTYMGAAVEFMQARSGELYAPENALKPLFWFSVVFAWALLALRYLGERIENFFAPEKPWRARAWATALGAGALGLIVGVGFYVFSRERVPTAAHADSVHTHRQPNIILIVMDTVRADHLSAYGYPRPTTPNLDQFAAQGVLFENAVSPSSWTLPSISSIFTGLLPHQHGANAVSPLDSGPPTLAEILAFTGYETVGFNANAYFGLAGWGIARGFELYDDDSFCLRHNLAATLMGRVAVQRAYTRLAGYNRFDRRNASELNHDVLRWFRHRSDRPYFLYVNYFDAHRPYATPSPYDRRFGKVSDDLLRLIDSQSFGKLPRALTPQEQDLAISSYDDCLAYLDAQVGELLDALRQSPDWPNTFVIITSDHGDGFNEHGTYDHGWNLYRELLHVPLIILGPGVPRGRRVSYIVRTREILVTAVNFAFKENSSFNRSSLRRFWAPGFKPDSYDSVAISELIDYTPHPDRPAFISLISPEFHYLHVSRGYSELYHWPTDPEEKHNLAESPQYRETERELSDLLYGYIGSSLRPWRGLPYLLALDRSGYSILRDAHQNQVPESVLPTASRPMGDSQAYSGLIPSALARQHTPDDEQVLKSIPYH